MSEFMNGHAIIRFENGEGVTPRLVHPCMLIIMLSIS